MQTPYEILSVGINADDVEIKQAYLQQVKNNPPERDNEKFQLIHEAYNLIKAKRERLNYELFTLPEANFDNLIDVILQTKQSPVINLNFLKKTLLTTIDSSLSNVLANPEK